MWHQHARVNSGGCGAFMDAMSKLHRNHNFHSGEFFMGKETWNTLVGSCFVASLPLHSRAAVVRHTSQMNRQTDGQHHCVKPPLCSRSLITAVHGNWQSYDAVVKTKLAVPVCRTVQDSCQPSDQTNHREPCHLPLPSCIIGQLIPISVSFTIRCFHPFGVDKWVVSCN